MKNNISNSLLQKAPMLLMWGRFFNMMLFTLPVIVLFYQYKGLTLGDFFLIQGLFSIIILFLEVPTGYIGDLFSRNKVILLSFLTYMTGLIIWYFFEGFWLILLGEAFFGLGIAFYSGTGEAYLYDVLKKQKKEKEFIKVQGRIEASSIFATALSAFIGGIIYNKFGPDTTILFEILAILIGFSFVLFLPDIKDSKRQVKEDISKWKDITNIVKYAINHPEIKWLMLYPAAFGTGTLILFWGLQPLMSTAAVPISLFGIIIGFNQLIRVTFVHSSDYLFRKLKTNVYSIIVFFILISGFISAILIPVIQNKIIIYVLLVVTGIAAASQASLRIITTSMVNHRIKPDERATVLSVKAMFSHIFTGVAMIALKPLFDGVGVQTTFMISMVVVLLTIYPLLKLLRLKLR